MNCSVCSCVVIMVVMIFISLVSYFISAVQADPDGSQLQIRALPRVSQLASDTPGYRILLSVTCNQPFALIGGTLSLSENDANDALVPRDVWTPFIVHLGSPLPSISGAGSNTVDIGGHVLGGPVGVAPSGSGNSTATIIYARASAGGSPNGDRIAFAPVVMIASNANCSTTSCSGSLSSCR